MGHSWDIWRQKIATNLHKQQQRARDNALILLLQFVNACYQLNIPTVSKTFETRDQALLERAQVWYGFP